MAISSCKEARNLPWGHLSRDNSSTMLACVGEEHVFRVSLDTGSDETVHPSLSGSGPEKSALALDHTCDRCCRHLPCAAFREKRWCQRFLEFECHTLEPVAAEVLLDRLARCLDHDVKRRVIAQERNSGLGIWCHTGVVESGRHVPSTEVDYNARLHRALRESLSPAGERCTDVSVRNLRCCARDAGIVVGLCMSYMDEGRLAGDQSLYDDLVKEFAEANPGAWPMT